MREKIHEALLINITISSLAGPPNSQPLTRLFKL